jgi:hypothetical protein
MKKILPSLALIIVLSSFFKSDSLKGIWQYAGGISKGTYFPAPKTHRLQRTYTDTNFEAVVLEEGEKPLEYEAGTYMLKPDSCLETQTFSLQGQQMVGVSIHYWYMVRNDTLILRGVLPNGASIEDYWKRVK